MTSRFIQIQCDNTFCPKCNALVRLLTDRDGMPGTHSFYLCNEGCTFIGQVGVGEVEAQGGTAQEISGNEVDPNL